MISSVQNSKVKWVRSLRRRSKDRRDEQAFVVEGVRLLEEVLESGWETLLVLYSDSLSERGVSLVEAFHSQEVPVELVSPNVMQAVSDTKSPQGILAVLKSHMLPLPDSLDFVLILDQLRDPGNLGTILRSADSAGTQAVYLSPGTVDPLSPKVLRGAMGAHFRMPILLSTWEKIKTRIKDSGLHVYLASANQGAAYFEVDFSRPIALIIGGEAHGAGETACKEADARVHIPMPGGGESLNASVAAGILLFEIAHQRGISV
jgi:TrmH family RNA methyltransferase